MRRLSPLWLLDLAVLLASAGFAQAPPTPQLPADWKSWNDPVPPFRIHANLYYVGAKEVAAYLFATPEGLILLDGGLPESAPSILANLATLGFRAEEVKYLLNSHAHVDHAGGLGELRRVTGAKLLASAGDAALLERGGLGDPFFADTFPFPAVPVDLRLADGDSVALGATTLTAHVTAGHTRGCTTWTARLAGGPRGEPEGDPAVDALILCSVTAPGYQLIDNPAWPDVLDAFEASFSKLEKLPCDLFLGPHASFFHLADKRARQLADPTGPNPFRDPEGCRAHLARKHAELRATVAAQRAAKGAPNP